MTKINDIEFDVSNLNEFFKEMSKFMKKWGSSDPNMFKNFGNQLSDLTKNFSSFQEQTNTFQQSTSSQMDNLNKLYETFQQSTSSQIDSLNKLCETFQQQLGEISSKQTDINSRLETLESNNSNLTTNLGQITEKVNSLQSSVTNITDTVIPELENKIEQTGGSGGSEWKLLYDKDSLDPEINRGETGGIGYYESLTALKGINVMPYNYFRLKVKFGSYLCYFTLNFGETKTSDNVEIHNFFTINEEASVIYCGAINTEKISDDYVEIYIASFYRIVYSASTKTWTRTRYTDDITNYYVCRIEAKA